MILSSSTAAAYQGLLVGFFDRRYDPLCQARFATWGQLGTRQSFPKSSGFGRGFLFAAAADGKEGDRPGAASGRLRRCRINPGRESQKKKLASRVVRSASSFTKSTRFAHSRQHIAWLFKIRQQGSKAEVGKIERVRRSRAVVLRE